jgi:hypothetical protein
LCYSWHNLIINPPFYGRANVENIFLYSNLVKAKFCSFLKINYLSAETQIHNGLLNIAFKAYFKLMLSANIGFI